MLINCLMLIMLARISIRKRSWAILVDAVTEDHDKLERSHVKGFTDSLREIDEVFGEGLITRDG